MRAYGYLVAVGLAAYQLYILAGIGAWVPALFVGVALPAAAISQVVKLRKCGDDKAAAAVFGVLLTAQLALLLTLAFEPLGSIIDGLMS